MSDFWLWFSTGIEHITDLNGYDHILFVALLVTSVAPKYWKKLVWYVTGFTIGHSVSLALSATNIINPPQSSIEFFIAITIVVTALFNAFNFRESEPKKLVFLSIVIPLFGGIHGMGFSYLLKSMLGHEQSVALPLLYFNLGLEVGQLVIVAIVLLFSLFLTSVIKFSFNYFKLIISCIVILISVKMLADRILVLL